MTADFELEPGACGASPPNKGRDEKMAVEADCVQSKRVISSDRGQGGGLCNWHEYPNHDDRQEGCRRAVGPDEWPCWALATSLRWLAYLLVSLCGCETTMP